jgi:hypothetical protein
MNKVSVVIDHQTVSYWKYEIINRLHEDGLLNNLYITENHSIDPRVILRRFSCSSLAQITVSELFTNIKRLFLNKGVQLVGELLWLSENPVNFQYADNIYYFSDSKGEHKFEKNFLLKGSEELKSITYLTKKNKNKRLVVNGCWTEEAKFSKSKTISNNLSSLKFLINSETKDSFELFEYSKNNFSTKKLSRVTSLFLKLYSLLFYYTSWSVYTYPRVLNIFNKNILDENMVEQIFNDKTWKFNADPFYLESENSLFIEKFNYLLGRGELAKYNFDTNEIRNVRSGNNIHFSYPCVFEYQGNKYMIPEAAQSNCIKIYKKNDDDSLSEVVTVTEKFAGIDPTIVEHNGMWYIFATDGSIGSNSHLNIYYSKNPLTEWSEHSLNPVKINVRTTRGGGEIFKEGTSMIRPTQNCYPIYGTSLIFNKVELLTPDSFKEVLVGEIKVSKNSKYKGIHTFSRNKDTFIIDLKTQEFFPFARFITILRARIKSNDGGLFLENSLSKRIAILFLFLIFIILIYLFGWRALSLFV